MSNDSAVASAAATTSLPTGTWKVDPVHSSVEFQVKHLGIATVKGQFNDFEGTLEVGPDGASAYGTVKVASVDTREPQRDEHLRSADFFEAETYPKIDVPLDRHHGPPAMTSSRSTETSRSTGSRGRSPSRRPWRAPRPTRRATSAWGCRRPGRSTAPTTR